MAPLLETRTWDWDPGGGLGVSLTQSVAALVLTLLPSPGDPVLGLAARAGGWGGLGVSLTQNMAAPVLTPLPSRGTPQGKLNRSPKKNQSHSKA